MTQKAKTVSRKVAIALGLLCVATLVALNFSIITYYSEMNSKISQIQTLNDQILDIQNQITNGTLTTPKLIGIGMEYSDNRANQNAPFLRVTGYICNVGTETANNCTLQVLAVQSGNTTGIDTSAKIESLESGAFTKVAFSGNLEWGN
jgi:predicted PurR-regulated permease PerM